MDYVLNKMYWLSTGRYKFSYRKDRYNPNTIHVEMFFDGVVVHKTDGKIC